MIGFYIKIQQGSKGKDQSY